MQLLAMMAVRKLLDFVFTRSELYWLDHILPGDERVRLEDEREIQARAYPQVTLPIDCNMICQMHIKVDLESQNANIQTVAARGFLAPGGIDHFCAPSPLHFPSPLRSRRLNICLLYTSPSPRD